MRKAWGSVRDPVWGATPGTIRRRGGPLGRVPVGVPALTGIETVAQGYLRGSDYNIMEERVNLTTRQRASEINSKAIRPADDMVQTTSQLV